MIFIEIFVGLFLISMGLIVHLGKQYDLIAGYNTMDARYNTMDEQKKQAFDIIRYARLFGITFYSMGIALIVFAIVFSLLSIESGYLMAAMLVLMLIGVGYLNLMGEIIKRKKKQQS